MWYTVPGFVVFRANGCPSVCFPLLAISQEFALENGRRIPTGVEACNRALLGASPVCVGLSGGALVP
jgi:hypothetical protein